MLAQIFGILGICFSVISMQAKKRKYIFIWLLLLNLASALNFLFLNNNTSSYICFFAILEMIINYIFEYNKKDVPIFVVIIYVFVNIFLGILSFTTFIDVLPIICSLIFCATIICKNEQNIRKLMLGNQSIWLIFDIIVKAYTFSVSNILTIVSTVIALKRFKEEE